MLVHGYNNMPNRLHLLQSYKVFYLCHINYLQDQIYKKAWFVCICVSEPIIMVALINYCEERSIRIALQPPRTSIWSW